MTNSGLRTTIFIHVVFFQSPWDPGEENGSTQSTWLFSFECPLKQKQELLLCVFIVTWDFIKSSVEMFSLSPNEDKI